MSKKNATAKERQHMAKVAALGCIACRKIGYHDTPAEIHHIRTGMGMGQRNSHYKTIPLCAQHHRHGADAIHRSKEYFESQFGTEEQLLGEVMELLP